MDKITERIIKNKFQCFFVSPHLDDVILSSGGLLSYLANKTRLFVITVFTKPSNPPYSYFTKKYLNDCKFTDAEKFFEKRKKNDKKIFNQLNIKSYYLDYVDAGWRKRKNIHQYPFKFNLFFSKINKEKKIVRKVGEQLKTVVSKLSKNKSAIIFSPLGFGHHIDHLITREACYMSFEKIVFYEDFPYNLGLKSTLFFNQKKFIKKNDLLPFIWNKGLNKKKRLIAHYKTQLGSLFGKNNIPTRSEKFFLRSRYP